MRTSRVPLALALALVAVTAAACVTERRPDGCDDPTVTIDLELAGTELVPDDPGVCRDQQVTLRFEADDDGVVHVHGYDHAVAATEYRAGEPIELDFVADRVGQFTIEIHAHGAPQGTQIGILTVHEP